ncbi:chromosome segregation protein Csm1/Pcs1-domain-containing protein [Cercophora samala]|uniref:Chromosome segregation protein Csm1/Pcs1-domain-containing protein n=1 Tax=Cercophora samala TaxID=330535 RepID=A0AA39ZKJ3_9PEZI|nr:chromosome segregation protein Csm1/Pcs1-domain-containing protein [Cercophora samala]
MPPKKRGAAAKATAASKVTKPEPKNTATTRRAAGRVAAAVEQEVLGNAPAKNAPAEKPAGRGRGRRAAVAATPVEEEGDTEMADTTTTSETTKATRGRPKKTTAGRTASASASPDETVEIPETQPSALEPGTPISDNDTAAPAIPPPQPRSFSVSPQKKRPSITTTSSSSSEADLRRRLGDLTKSHSALESRYNSLRDTTVPQAEKTFDSYRKTSESKSKLADSLIASLKAELATAKQSSAVIPSLQSDLSAAQAQIAKFEAQVAELNKTMAEQKTEIKALNMKLAAARNAEAAANSRSATAQVPGSAMKKTLGISGVRGTGMQVQEATLSAQRKEDLYADLTGLIVRGVNVLSEGVEFDCLQTGRNGTLHFKLTMSSGDGDESQCEYNPMLDTNRDRALIDVLPEFLVDEIAFPRAQAGKFYQRIMRALNES